MATTTATVMEDAGLVSFLKKVCLNTAGAILLTGGTAAAAIKFIPRDLVSDKALLVGGGVVGIGSMIAILFQTTKYKIDEKKILVPEYSLAQKILYPTFFISEGVMMAPMLKMVMTVLPEAIPISLCLTGATVAGMVTKPKGALLKWGPAVNVGLWGLLGVAVITAFKRSPVLELASSIIGVGLFAGATAHDIHDAVKDYDSDLKHAATFYLDFLNMFINILEIYIKIEEERRKKKDSSK